jgi:hypothetical protein
MSSDIIRVDGEIAVGGVGGSGLFKFESVFLDDSGAGIVSTTEKSSNETVWGVLSFTSFPCRCRGVGGGFFFSFFAVSPPTRLTCSSSEAAIS